MFRRCFLPLTALCLILLAVFRAAAPSHANQAPPVNIEKLIDEFEAAKQRFVTDKEKTKAALLKALDVQIGRIERNPRLKPAERLDAAKSLRADRKLIETQDDLPENADLAPAMWVYGASLVRSYRPLSRKFDQVMNACLKAGKSDLAEEIKAAKEEFDNKNLPGRKHFAAGTLWTGTLHNGANATLVHFRVTNLTGTQFKGRMAYNVQVAGHPVFDTGGSLDGIEVGCKTLTSVVGKTKLAKLEGFVIGQTLLLELVTVPAKGPPKASHIVLRKR